MSRVQLKRLIGKSGITRELFSELIGMADERLSVVDSKGVVIVGPEIVHPAHKVPIQWEDETLGWVQGGKKAEVLAGLLQQLAAKESERKTMGQEVLTLYREINIIYDFSEKLARAIDPEEIASLTLEEAGQLIEASGGMIVALPEGVDRKDVGILSRFGKCFGADDEALADSRLREFVEGHAAEIVNDVQEDRRFDWIPEGVRSMLYAPMKVKNRALGMIVMVNEESVLYKAGDLKLLTTLAIQTASAIESARLYRKVISEAREREEALKRVDKLKDEFLANTSHELRTPLQGIIGLSEALIERAGTSEEKENLSMIISSGKRLNSLVNDILDFSKLKNFDIVLRQRSVDLYALVNLVLRNNVPLIKGKDLKLINEVHPDLPDVFADENRIQQVLYNLIGNAIKFTESGHVKVSAQVDGDLVQLVVEDTGIGIPDEKKELIFQEFQQGDGSTARKFAGTGLGLSISKRLIEMHGGALWVESEEGKGSRFFISVPVSTEQSRAVDEGRAGAGSMVFDGSEEDQLLGTKPASQSESVGASFARISDSINILVVDDEPINHQVLKNHLSDAQYRITRALNGREALEALDNGMRYDLVLLDVMMPGMSGYEVCQKIREKYLPSELPVIMVTAKNQVQDLVSGLHNGANDYLGKPFTRQEFLARISTQIDLHRIFDITRRFVPNEFIESLGRQRITEVHLGDQASLEVTVLFADIRSYTTLSENMTPDENFRFIDAFNRRIGPVIQRNGGFINQYLGDAIMALFPHQSSDALRAAVEVQRMITGYNKQREKKSRKPISVGIGIHTGPLIMGITGDEERMDAAIISDTVNTASRIESLSKHYGARILLSQACVEGLGSDSDFHYRFLGKVQVKGKTHTIDIYECFDGDLNDMADAKINTAQAFDSGMRSYFNRDFTMAAVSFQEVVKAYPQDAVARLFLQKCGQYIASGVPDDWDGVEVMQWK